MALRKMFGAISQSTLRDLLGGSPGGKRKAPTSTNLKVKEIKIEKVSMGEREEYERRLREKDEEIDELKAQLVKKSTPFVARRSPRLANQSV